MAFLQNAWVRYLRILDRYPLRTQMVQTSILMGAGDAISQFAIERKDRFEASRVIRFSVIGCFFVAPTIRVWYLTLERWFGAGVTVKTTLAKVGTDQLAFAPIFTAAIIGVIGSSQSVTNSILTPQRDKTAVQVLKTDMAMVRQKLRAEYVDIVLNGWKLWPAAQLVNFYLVPFLVRPLVVSVVALFWNTYLAWKTNRAIRLASGPCPTSRGSTTYSPWTHPPALGKWSCIWAM